jgi:site-specific recombinase XerC
MNELKVNATTYKDTAKSIANIDIEAFLEKATPEQLEQVSKIVIARRLTDHLDASARLAGIGYLKERDTFIGNISKVQSKHTKRAYRSAIGKVEAYAAKMSTTVLELTPAQADDFIYAQKASGLSAATIRITIAAISSFFTWLERRHAGAIANPFRGTKARPENKKTRPLDIPNAQEIEVIIKELPPALAAAVSIMAYRGLRVGALPSLSIKDGRFMAYSKGKEYKGDIGANVIAAIRVAKLKLHNPFAHTNANALERIIGYYIGKLYKAGKIRTAFSCHDFRHAYAVAEYQKDKDIYRVKNLLNHSSIAVTDSYLRSLGICLPVAEVGV